MNVREDHLNGRIATIIGESVKGTQCTIEEENDGTLPMSNGRPDILITKPSAEPPVVIEND